MSAPVHYRDMTDAQMLAWGAAEQQARISDLAGLRSAESLKAAQNAAESRRKTICATRGQAADMVIRASRAARVAKATGSAPCPAL